MLIERSMRRNAFDFRDLLVAIAVLLTVAGHFLRHPWLVYVSKPLATILILSISFSHWRARKNSYSFWISFGLLFSLAGDIALLRPDSYFLSGLLAFLFTHIAYLFAFTRDAKFPAGLVLWLPYLAVPGAAYALLFPSIPSNLRAPVALYSLLLASMAAQAMGRSLILKTRPARLAAIGAVLFLFSDVLLALEHFHARVLVVPALTLVPYYLAQWLIAYSSAPAEATL
jgi:uncharacterized membrane protein YhhN